MITRFCKTYIKTIAKYIQVPPILNFSVQFFFNHMGNLFNCEDHFYFHVYIHISKKLSFR